MAFCVGPASAASDSDILAMYRWKARLLVVVAPSEGDRRAAEQRRIFQKVRQASRDRDLILVERTGSTPDAVSLRRRFGAAAGDFRAVLVGKDGGDKIASSEPIDAQRLFAEIDTMPMRRDEQRQRGR